MRKHEILRNYNGICLRKTQQSKASFSFGDEIIAFIKKFLDMLLIPVFVSIPLDNPVLGYTLSSVSFLITQDQFVVTIPWPLERLITKLTSPQREQSRGDW